MSLTFPSYLRKIRTRCLWASLKYTTHHPKNCSCEGEDLCDAKQLGKFDSVMSIAKLRKKYEFTHDLNEDDQTPQELDEEGTEASLIVPILLMQWVQNRSS